MNVKNFWNRHFLGAEAGVVVFLTLLALLWIFALDGSSQVDSIMANNRTSVYQTVAAIAGSLLGFSITATSIVFGLTTDESLTLLRGSKYYSALWKTLFQTTYFLGGLTVISLVSLVFDKDGNPCHLLFVLTLTFTALSIARICRTLWILRRIVHIRVVSDRERDSRL